MESILSYEVQSGAAWGWKVVLDLFLGGAGVGAFLLAVGIHAGFRGRYRRICQTAAWIAPVLIVAGLVALLLKMGRPELMVLVFTQFAPTAPLWWGGILQTVLVIGTIWYALRWRSTDAADDDTTRRVGLLLMPIAVIVGAYHGLLLAVVTSRPLWNTGPTVVAAMLGFATTGIAAVLLTHLLRMKRAGRLADTEHLGEFLDDMRPVRTVLVAALVAQLGTFFLWWLSLAYGSLRDIQALAAANASYGTVFWWGGIGLGLVLPLLLGAYCVARKAGAGRQMEVNMILLTSTLILVGGFLFRLAVVLAGQSSLPIATLR